MEYISARKTAEKWDVNVSLVRRLCNQGRIKGAVLEDSGWRIPAKAKRPGAPTAVKKEKKEIPPLAAKLLRQKTKKNYHEFYDYVQINLTYSSSRMASCRLSRDQVTSILLKGKVQESFEPMKVSDLIEVLNHGFCVEYILDHVNEILSEKFVTHLHSMLMAGTVDERKMKVACGRFRTAEGSNKSREWMKAEYIKPCLKSLLSEYESLETVKLGDILNFHVQFEKIAPFDDGNGRVGRLILFKECLRHEVTPFILDDKRRGRYLDGIQRWEENPDVLVTVVQESQKRFEAQRESCELSEHEYWYYHRDRGNK